MRWACEPDVFMSCLLARFSRGRGAAFALQIGILPARISVLLRWAKALDSAPNSPVIPNCRFKDRELKRLYGSLAKHGA